MTNLQTCKGRFNHSDSVTIDVYDLSDNSLVVDQAVCTEISNTGLFKYKPNLTVTTYKEYVWIMTNGSLFVDGSFELNPDIGNLQSSIDEIMGGSGQITWIYTVTKDDLVTPIADVEILISTDVNKTNVIARGFTDQYGQATFYLDAGTVYIWRYKSGYTFTNPDTEVVS